MSNVALKFRGLPIAVAALLLSAGLVFAAGGLNLPGAGGTDGTNTDATSQTVDNGDGLSEPAPAVDGDEDAWDNHGDLVSEAAQMATPVAPEGTEGFKNHGAFVSCVAKLAYGKKGVEAPAEFVLANLTPEACGQAEDDTAASSDDGPGKSDKVKDKVKGKSQGKGHGRGRGG